VYLYRRKQSSVKNFMPNSHLFLSWLISQYIKNYFNLTIISSTSELGAVQDLMVMLSE